MPSRQRNNLEEERDMNTPATVRAYYNHVEHAAGHTILDPAHHIVHVRNARGLLSTEQWTFVYTYWQRVSVR